MVYLKSFLKNFFFVFGIEAFLLMLLADNKSGLSITNMRFFAAVTATVCLSGTLLFRERVTRKSLWLRRLVVIAISATACAGFPIAFGLVRRDTLEGYLIYAIIVAAALVLLSVTAYLVADRIENNMLKKINKKLEQNGE